MSAPGITALICTRDRGAMVADTVRGIMANDHPDFEVRVIDQSTGGESEEALAEWRTDSRFHYTRTATEGLARARNIGVGQARAEVIAMTDDDCQVPSDWLRRMAAAFTADDGIGIVFGNVLPASYDPARGFISAYRRTNMFVAVDMRDKAKVEGIGACMGIRRSAWKSLGGFDQMLGAGSKFRSADDTDFVIRALLGGYKVCETPDVRVVHHGFRTWREGSALIRGYLFGIGAMLAKHIRCRNWSVLGVVQALAYRWMFGKPVVDFGFVPGRSMRLSGFLRGFMAGSIAPIDRPSGVFVVPAQISV